MCKMCANVERTPTTGIFGRERTVHPQGKSMGIKAK